jgi:L-asparagine oxygenase
MFNATADTAAATGAVQTVDPLDAVHIGELLEALAAAGPVGVDDPAWVARARAVWDYLPVGVRSALRRFRRHSGTRGILVLKGIPLGDATMPPTPTVKGSAQRTPTVHAAALVTLATGLGDPFAFLPEKDGHLVQDVVPVPGMEEFEGNAGSTLLTFHTENAFDANRPDFVMLLCLRPDHDRVAGLRTACSREVLPLLSADARDVLFRAEFRTSPPPSFQLSGGDRFPPHAVFTGDPTDPDMQVDLSATQPLTGDAATALAELGDLFDRTAVITVLQPGDLVIVDNRVTVHGRTPFTPRYDGKDRWLQRTFVATNLRDSRGRRPDDGYVLAV